MSVFPHSVGYVVVLHDFLTKFTYNFVVFEVEVDDAFENETNTNNMTPIFRKWLGDIVPY